MSISESQIYIEFLRYCLDTSRVIPRSVAEINWHALLLFAREQCIVGIYWQGIITPPNLPEGEDPFYGNKPTDDDIMEWMADIQDILTLNKTLNRRSSWVWNNFNTAGFKACILKGQGNALYYPNPSLRTPGDIDVWLTPQAKDNKNLSLSERRSLILEYVSSIVTPSEIRYIHVDFPVTEEAPIEVHYTPSFKLNPIANKKLQKFFDDNTTEQMENMVEFEQDGAKLKFSKPTFEFNIVYQLLHLHKHVLFEGVGLRQLIDYYYLLKSNEITNKEDILKQIDLLGLKKFTSGLMFILQEHLGLDNKYLLLQPNKKEGNLIFHDVIKGGNFGRTNETIRNIEDSNNHLKRYLSRELYNMRLIWRYPSEMLCSPFYYFFNYFWIKRQDKKYCSKSKEQD